MSICSECAGKHCGQVGQSKCREQLDYFDDEEWDDDERESLREEEADRAFHSRTDGD